MEILKKGLYIILIIFTICSYMITFTGLGMTIEEPKSELRTNLSTLMIFIGISTGLTLAIIRIRKKYKNTKKIINLTFGMRRISIEDLSLELNKSLEETKGYIIELIRKGTIDAYINEKNEVIMNTNNNVQDVSNEKVTSGQEMVMVECKYCGALGEFIKGKENRCEYCNSVLTKSKIVST